MTGESSICASVTYSYHHLIITKIDDVQILERQIGCTGGVPCQVSALIPYTCTHSITTYPILYPIHVLTV